MDGLIRIVEESQSDVAWCQARGNVIETVNEINGTKIRKINE